jgi:hypothetical protein
VQELARVSGWTSVPAAPESELAAREWDLVEPQGCLCESSAARARPGCHRTGEYTDAAFVQAHRSERHLSAVGRQRDVVADRLHRQFIRRVPRTDCCRQGPGHEINPVIVLSPPDADGSRVSDFGDDEPAALVPCRRAMRGFYRARSGRSHPRRSTHLAEGG